MSDYEMCLTSCSCLGQLPALACPLMPGCRLCTHVELIAVFLEPVYLEPGESVDHRVGRDDMISQLPGRYQSRPN